MRGDEEKKPAREIAKEIVEGHVVDPAVSRPDRVDPKTIVQLSAKDTADWLGGKQVDWMDNLTDPQMQMRYKEHQGRMSEASYGAIVQFARALKPDSPQTHARLMELTEQSKAGDLRASELLIVLMVSLMRTGFGLGTQ